VLWSVPSTQMTWVQTQVEVFVFSIYMELQIEKWLWKVDRS
jgi:hypothetical protein